MGWTYCRFCTLELPICSRFVGEREASEAVSGAAVHKFTSAHGERSVLPSSGCAAVSGCCRPRLHATQHYSSPNATVLDCRPKFGPAQWTADELRCVTAVELTRNRGCTALKKNPASQSITRFDCRAAVCQPNYLQKC